MTRPVTLMAAAVLLVIASFMAPARAGAEAARPRVLFMIAEQNIESEFYIYWWSWWRGGEVEYKGTVLETAASETRLKEDFLRAGFDVVDPSAVKGQVEIPNAYRIEDLDSGGIKAFGEAVGADVVVKGRALAREGVRIKESPIGLYSADVTAVAVNVDDGRVVASGRGHGTSRHISPATGSIEALERAADELASGLIAQIEQRWAARAAVITIRVAGLSGYDDLVAFKGALKDKLSGIEAVAERRFEGSTAEIEVVSARTAHEIADEMAAALGLHVSGVSGNLIEVGPAR